MSGTSVFGQRGVGPGLLQIGDQRAAWLDGSPIVAGAVKEADRPGRDLDVVA